MKIHKKYGVTRRVFVQTLCFFKVENQAGRTCVSHHGPQVSQSECQCVCGNANEREWPLSVVSHLVTQTDLIISSYSVGDTRIFPVRAAHATHGDFSLSWLVIMRRSPAIILIGR